MSYTSAILIIWTLCIPIAARCQTSGASNTTITLPSIALIDVEPKGNITMSFLPPTDAGNPISPPQADMSKWLNYSSAVASGGNSRSISASINQAVPGVDLMILTETATSGGGNLGVPVGQVLLGTTPVVIVSGIRGAYTGNGQNNGHRLRFNLSTNNYSDLGNISNMNIIISFTIIE